MHMHKMLECVPSCLLPPFLGIGDIDCGPHPVTLAAGSRTASVNISTIDDEDPECDETFTARIDIGRNSSNEGFRLGPMSNVTITVKDDEGDAGLMHYILLKYILHYDLYTYCNF